MTALDALEQKFLEHVRGGEPFPRAWCRQGLVDSDVGLSIYSNAYRSRLREALEADHPVLSTYLGDALWAKFCHGYVTDHPSRVRSLRHFGASAPAWLAQNEPFSTHPAIAELARFERGLLDTFDAADAERIQWVAMQQLDPLAWPVLRLRFHPSLRLLRLATNAVEIWRTLKEDREPPAAGASASPAHLLWRDAERISRFRPVSDAEFNALTTCLLAGRDFSSLCERLAMDHAADGVPAMAIGFLRQWFDEGVVCGLLDEPEAPGPGH